MVPFPCVCIIFGVFLTIASTAYTAKECTPSITSSHCQQSYTTRVKYHRRCGDWRRWWTCTEYKDEYRERTVCCPHYTGSYCDIAYCSHTQFNRHQHLACKINYTNDSVTHRNFDVERNSGGTCVKPNVCQCCNAGFYADHSDGYCKICPFIPMCEFRSCLSPYVSPKEFQNECLYCQFENAPKRFQRAYKYNNLSIACEKTCSWKSDSNRCFPGFCSDEYKTSCICANGFNSTSEHCSRITKEIIITDAHVRFVDTDETTVTSPEDINSPRAVPKKWTNNVLLQKFEFSLGATYDVSGDIPMFKNYTDPHTNESLSHFVIDFAYGIITGKMKAIFVREEEPDRSLLKKEDCNSSCHERSPCPVNSMYRCESGNVSVSWLGLKHNDQIIVSVELQNGGYLVFENRDDRRIANDATKEWPTQYVPLKGIRTTEIYQFHWDTRLPYYDCSKSECPSLPVNVPDVSKTNIVYIHWNIWSDDLSGIDYYDIEVFEMHTVGNSTDNNEIVEIMEPRIHQPGLKKLESTINVTVPGMYAVHFTAFDRAGNFMSARGLLLYDNNELIELGRGTIEVIQAKYYSEKGWITYPSSLVYVTWKDMFVKTDHFKHSWLAKVKKFDSVNSTYDDINGKRTIGMVPNVKGISIFGFEKPLGKLSIKCKKQPSNLKLASIQQK